MEKKEKKIEKHKFSCAINSERYKTPYNRVKQINQTMERISNSKKVKHTNNSSGDGNNNSNTTKKITFNAPLARFV